MFLKKIELIITWSNSFAVARLDASNSKHPPKKSKNNGDQFSGSLSEGDPWVAIKKSA